LISWGVISFSIRLFAVHASFHPLSKRQIEELQKEKSDPNAQLNLATGYELGRDISKAAHWYRLTAKKGVHDVLIRLAQFHIQHDGLPENEVMAYASTVR
jgi:TPR repeat protein